LVAKTLLDVAPCSSNGSGYGLYNQPEYFSNTSFVSLGKITFLTGKE
jgi:hypothetical protein